MGQHASHFSASEIFGLNSQAVNMVDLPGKKMVIIKAQKCKKGTVSGSETYHVQLLVRGINKSLRDSSEFGFLIKKMGEEATKTTVA